METIAGLVAVAIAARPTETIFEVNSNNADVVTVRLFHTANGKLLGGITITEDDINEEVTIRTACIDHYDESQFYESHDEVVTSEIDAIMTVTNWLEDVAVALHYWM